jgi:hypothetical protein
VSAIAWEPVPAGAAIWRDTVENGVRALARGEGGRSMKRIDEIEARERAASPGPWRASSPDRGEAYVFGLEQGYEGEMSVGDARFIAHAREDVAEDA